MSDKLNLGIDWTADATATKHTLLEIRHDDERLIALDYKGGAEFGESYSPDEAVRIFWEFLGQSLPFIVEQWCAANGYALTKDEASA